MTPMTADALREIIRAGDGAERQLTDARTIPADPKKRPEMDESYEPVAVLRAKEALWDERGRLIAALALEEALRPYLQSYKALDNGDETADPVETMALVWPSVKKALSAFRASGGGE